MTNRKCPQYFSDIVSAKNLTSSTPMIWSSVKPLLGDLFLFSSLPTCIFFLLLGDSLTDIWTYQITINGLRVVLISASGFPFRFSVTILAEFIPSWISRVSIIWAYVSQLALHPKRKVIHILITKESMSPIKRPLLAIYSMYKKKKKKKQVIQVTPYLKSMSSSSSTHQMRRLLCTTYGDSL